MAKLIQDVKQSLVRRHQLESELGVSRSFIYEGMATGRFPKNIKIGARGVAWRRADIDAWIADPSGYRAESAQAA